MSYGRQQGVVVVPFDEGDEEAAAVRNNTELMA